MSFIEFESAREKEKNRQELRDAREQMLKEAESRFHKREERERQKVLKGESNFLLPSIEKKLKKSSKKSKKVKKEKKQKSKKKKRKKSSSSDSDDSDDNEKSHKKRKKKKYSSPSSSSDSSSGSEDEWVEKSSRVDESELKKPSETPLVRDSWMFETTIATFSKEKREPKKDERKDIDSYDPSKSVKELNPYWKDGGSGLPSTFRRPKEDSDDEDVPAPSKSYTSKPNVQRGNWKKKDASVPSRTSEPPSRKKSSSGSSSDSKSENEEEKEPESNSSMKNFLTDQQMNELGAKIVKAEIMGNEALAKQLKEKLELARECRKNVKVPEKPSRGPSTSKKQEAEEIILTKSSTHGTSRPLESQDPYSGGGRHGGSKKKRQKATDTHVGGERVKYFPDDDKYDIKQMFEREKFTTSSDGDAQFTKIAMASSKAGSSRDNLEDIFASEAYKSMSDGKTSDRDRARAINEHQKTTRVLESCEMCIDSAKIEKQLIVALGNKVYLSLPWHEGLQPGHCLISTTAHISCATNLDEEVWAEVNDFRKALTRMFASRKQDVIFFETVRYLHKNPHMVIHCVPSKNFEMAPFYFKKAIQESEREWSMNKQLIDLRKERKDLRRAIPRGLPYFWVNFGMDDGFAHVIEEQERFPPNFAQEVIGGILELDPRAFRKPRREYNPIAKVKQFAEWWKHYDCTQD